MKEYKGYVASVEYDSEAELFHGEVVGIRDVVTFQGNSVKELKKAFQDSIDDYLDFCRTRGEAPDKPCSGQFVLRIGSELHHKLTVLAGQSGKSLNAWIADRLADDVQRETKRLRPAAKVGRARRKRSRAEA
jgi:predicted HicB family RNase H-like nuclease